MHYPGAYQMSHFIRLFEELPWWKLIPDIKHQAVVAGYGEWSKPDYVTTAVSSDKKIMVSYIPQLTSVIVDFGYLIGDKFKIRFYDPETGAYIKETTVNDKSVQRIVSPPADDLVLVIESQ